MPPADRAYAGEWPAPFTGYRTEVPPTWLDYNGHMHDASYGIALSDANEQLFDALGLGLGYREATGCAYYTVETHLRYLAECRGGDVLAASTILVTADDKRIRLYTELHNQTRDELAATGEVLYLHVDTTRGTVSPLAREPCRRLMSCWEAHRKLDRPAHLGQPLR